MMFMQHTGGLALSAFRTRKLLESARQRVASLLLLKAHHIHFIALNRELDDVGQRVLKDLLSYPAAGEDELVRQAAFASQQA